MQFLVIARDGTDAEAPARRAAARPAHLENARRMKADGHLIIGGAMLDEAGTMIGSSMLAEYPDRAALDAALAADPYTVQGVWQSFEIRPFRIADL
ncbi:YciI family protein [Tistrella mobilis]|jgi:uncharacterized protein YciI|uniref:YciI family protein n=1 Tax=Tistrella mobilis TaxID=171437 RepID=UPI003555CB8D